MYSQKLIDITLGATSFEFRSKTPKHMVCTTEFAVHCTHIISPIIYHVKQANRQQPDIQLL